MSFQHQLLTDSTAGEALLRAKMEEIANQLEALKHDKKELTYKLDDAKQCLVKQEEDIRRATTDRKMGADRYVLRTYQADI